MREKDQREEGKDKEGLRRMWEGPMGEKIKMTFYVPQHNKDHIWQAHS